MALLAARRQQVGELVDDRKRLLSLAQRVQRRDQPGEIADVRAHAQQWSQTVGEAAELRSLGATLSHQDDRRLAVSEGAKQPRLADAAATVEDERVAVATIPPVLQALDISRAVEELVARREHEILHRYNLSYTNLEYKALPGHTVGMVLRRHGASTFPDSLPSHAYLRHL